MKVTFYDRLSAGMISLVLGLIVAVFAIIMWWLSTRPQRVEFLVPLEMIEAGGSEDGVPDETLHIESPEDPTENPSLSEEILDTTEVAEVVENLVELSDQATQLAEPIAAEMSETSGTPGSSQGTGRRGLGSGPGDGGIPNEQRWFIRYADEASLAEYARQLDFFKIELGALLQDGQLVYLSNLSNASPSKRVSRSGKSEQRLYMTWQGGGRKAADIKLFEKAGVDASRAVLFHFYEKQTEQLLLTKEYEYAKRNMQEIRRTYYVVVRQGSGFDFVVTRQIYLR